MGTILTDSSLARHGRRALGRYGAEVFSWAFAAGPKGSISMREGRPDAPLAINQEGAGRAQDFPCQPGACSSVGDITQRCRSLSSTTPPSRRMRTRCHGYREVTASKRAHGATRLNARSRPAPRWRLTAILNVGRSVRLCQALMDRVYIRATGMRVTALNRRQAPLRARLHWLAATRCR
ncbi:hypothetical protein KCP73_23380 [Salmonella enterica subsp. enterica]|nr:hypothetical protein KCP73_23380 [Salmonella enterica subsp. enterica]